MYRTGVIAAEAVDQAYVLVQPVMPELGLEGWRRMCARPEARTGGSGDAAGHDTVLAAVGPRGYIHGLCLVRPSACPGRRHGFDIPLLVIGSALDPVGVAIDLLRGAASFCRARGGGPLRILLSRSDAATRRAIGVAVDQLAREFDSFRIGPG